MGLKNGDIKDDQIFVSSHHSLKSLSKYGRLGMEAVEGVNIGGWMPDLNSQSHYFRVDFLKAVKISGVITQGRQDAAGWIETFKLRYSLKKENFYWFKESGKPKVNIC